MIDLHWKPILTGAIVLLLVVSTVTLGFGSVESSPEKINETTRSEENLPIDRISKKERAQEDEIDFKTRDRWPKKQEEKGRLDGKEDVSELNPRKKVEHQLNEDNYTTRDPINIYGNEEFHEKAEENNWSGDGTEQDPYIIQGYEIDGREPTYAIIIGHTDVHFVIRNNYLYNASFPVPYWYTGAVTLVNVTNGMVNNNTIRFSSHGINLSSSYDNEVSNNTLLDNHEGVWIITSHNNTVTTNNITNENKGPIINSAGTDLQNSEDNIVTENRISNFARGVFADGGSKNLIYHNIFIDNEVHAEDQGNNIWNKHYPIGGNYWGNHTSPDEYKGPHQDVSGSDGIVDEAKDIEEDNIDQYPLATPTPPSLEEFELEIDSTEGGSVIEPGEGTFICDTIELEAEADEDQIFDGWTGDIAGIKDPESPETRITIWDNSSITANFRELEDFDLNIDVEGEGTVKVDGEDVDQNFQKTYQEGTSINLTAIPSEGSYFDGWTGDHTGIKEQVKIEMDEDKDITAVFDEARKIYDWYDLDEVRNNLHADHVLMNDLGEDTDGYNELVDVEKGWKPMGGEEDLLFRGAFDGNRNEIRSLFIDRPEENYTGLFGYMGDGAEIKRLRVIDAELIGNHSTGGLVGENDEGTIENLYVEGPVDGNKYVGGLVGQNTGTVKNSSATGEISGEAIVGGLLGKNDGMVKNTYSRGDVIGLSGPMRSYAGGGLVGSNDYGTVKNSYAAGNVSGFFMGGGLVGSNDGYVFDSFWDDETTGQDPNYTAGTNKTTEKMKDVATYTDTDTEGLNETWDFVATPYDDEGDKDIWDIDEEINDGYPFLVWNHYHTLDVDIEGEGTVDMDPEKEYYEPGTEVTLTADPDSDWTFVKWGGDMPEGDEENDTLTVTIDEDKQITAIFEEDKDIIDKITDKSGLTYIFLLLVVVTAVVIYKKKKGEGQY
ncbi:MAG: InlB B-repeat-containing protein [Candidatus Saliniplasma sp.]